MAWRDGWDGGWKPYVPVAKRRAQAASYAAKLAKKEKRSLAPVKIDGRKITASFWGQAWCDNLERYSDFANRLPRGRTYVRNGSVVDLQIKNGKIQALVSGSEVYTVTISIRTLQKAAWKTIKKDCSRSIDSLIDLLQGKFDQGVMQRLTQRDGGLFPKPDEIEIDCSCPDWAGLCKHVAAVMYGVGARLDSAPELLFLLRDVDHLELIGQAATVENLDQTLRSSLNAALAGSDLGELFGIELDSTAPRAGDIPATSRQKAKTRKPTGSKPKNTAAKSPGKRLPKAVVRSAKPEKTIRKRKGAKTRTKTRAPKPAPVAATRATTRR